MFTYISNVEFVVLFLFYVETKNSSKNPFISEEALTCIQLILEDRCSASAPELIFSARSVLLCCSRKSFSGR